MPLIDGHGALCYNKGKRIRKGSGFHDYNAEELQSFHESDTTVDYPSRKVSAQTRLAVRSEGDYWGPESLGFSWELPQLTRTQEGEAE